MKFQTAFLMLKLFASMKAEMFSLSKLSNEDLRKIEPINKSLRSLIFCNSKIRIRPPFLYTRERN